MSRSDGATAATHGSFAALCADEQAFDAWYSAALPVVYGFVHGRTGGDALLAEEVTAEAFFEAVRARNSFAGRSDPVTWICSIARNRLIDHYRASAREERRHLRLVEADSKNDDDASWSRLDDRDVVLASLASLRPVERTALLLRYLDGYSVRETARLIGRSEAATQSLLMRAREHVRAEVAGGKR